MQNGVLNENCELIGQIREATRGLYLRNCRAVWNECVSRGYLTSQEYPFSNVKKKKLVSIPVGDTRKDHYLNVQQMTELYRVFIEKRYPDTWKKGYAEKAHYSLGLFLVQYLCNCFNMADTAELKYSKFYFDSGRKAFKFKRVKTRNRTEGGGEVIIPIIEPLQKILDEIAAEPVLNGFVFPNILQGATQHIRPTNASVSLRRTQMCKTVSSKSVRMFCIGKSVHREHGADILTERTSLMPKWRRGISHRAWGMQSTKPLQKDTSPNIRWKPCSSTTTSC